MHAPSLIEGERTLTSVVWSVGLTAEEVFCGGSCTNSASVDSCLSLMASLIKGETSRRMPWMDTSWCIR